MYSNLPNPPFSQIRQYIGLAALFIAPFLIHCADTGPVMAYELQGKWCTTVGTDHMTGSEVCLTVDEPRGFIPYTWTINGGQCVENGRLTGGLEFTPDTDSQLCLAPEFGPYFAVCEWSATGLNCLVDGHNEALGLNYQRE